MARHLKLHEYADYSPNDVNWLIERLKPYTWALKFEGRQFTCIAWIGDGARTNYRNAVGYSRIHATLAMADAHDMLMDFLDEGQESD